jgi:hypothetical protein
MATIKSKSDLFRGEMVEKPRRAQVSYDAAGVPQYVCPNCSNFAGEDDCDVMGAEPNCLFCNQCNREFEY